MKKIFIIESKKKKLLLLLLLSISYIFITFKFNKNFLSKILKKELPIINNYRLFNTTKNPYLSILFNFSNSEINLDHQSLLYFISSLNEHTFKNIQIIMIYDLTSNLFKNDSSKFIIKDKRIELYKYRSKNWKNNFIDLVQKIKGKFFIIFEEFIEFEKNELQKIYDNVKGSINNIFHFSFQNNKTYYLIRTKICRDFVDSEYDFNNYNDIINFFIQQPNPQINYIPVAFCPNNYYTPLTYTSMISILITKRLYTYILFYLIISIDFSNENIQLLESLYEQFDYFNITFIKMDNRYEKAYTRRYLSKSAFYRLSLGELLPNLNKVIYLDSDTIVLKDLSNLYDLNFMGKIFLATLLTFDNRYHNYSINTGVLLINLKKMRTMKIEKHVLTLLNNNFSDPIYHDQAIINLYYKKYIGFLSPEFNKFATFKNYLNGYYKDISGYYDYDSLYFFLKFPSILHYAGPPDIKTYNYEDWYYFARKSKYFQMRSHNYSYIFNYSL